MSSEINVPDETLVSQIYLLRGKKVMIDRDLAKLYGVETKALKRAVKRNITRFPPDFMFEMSPEEFDNWRYQIGTSNSDRLFLGKLHPLAREGSRASDKNLSSPKINK